LCRHRYYLVINRASLTKEYWLVTCTDTQHTGNLKWVCVCETAVVLVRAWCICV
jgi:hypothetical protein